MPLPDYKTILIPLFSLFLFAAIGILTFLSGSASSPVFSAEAEDGLSNEGVSIVHDPLASDGKAVRFVPSETSPLISAIALANAAKTSISEQMFTAQSPDKPYSLAVDADPVPTYSRFELRSGDRWINDSNNFPNDDRQRSMLRGNTYWPFNQTIWFSGSIRYTTDGFRTGYSGYYTELMCFFHDNDGGEAGDFKKGEIQFTIRQDGNWKPRLTIRTSGDPTGAAISTTAQTVERANIDFSPHNGHWIHVVGRLNFHWSQGEATMWINGQQVFSATGIPLGYNDPKGPYFKTGIYRTGDTHTGVAEWANVEIGTASLANRVQSPLAVPK